MSKKSRPANGDEYISVGRAAKMLGVSTTTIRQWCEKGIIECLRLPTRMRRIKKSEIDKILKNNETGETGEDINGNV